MSIPSPIYNPDWKTVHDAHADLREQAHQESNALHAQINALYKAGEPANSKLSRDLRHQAFEKNEEWGARIAPARAPLLLNFRLCRITRDGCSALSTRK